MFIVKASYHGETRRFTFAQPTFPTFEQLYNQLYRVFPNGQSYYLSKMLLTPNKGVEQYIAREIHSASEYSASTAQFVGESFQYAKLRFNVLDETPRKQPYAFSSLSRTVNEQQRSAPVTGTIPHSISTAAASSSQSCCTAHHAKTEVEALYRKFLADYSQILNVNFGAPSPPAIDMSRLTTPSVVPNTSASDPPLCTVNREEPELKALYPDIWCDYCGCQVRGIRYKCLDCTNYDLCSDCVDRQGAKEVHASNCEQRHTFVAIFGPTEPTTSAPRSTLQAVAPSERGQPPVHTGVTCDVCSQGIVGIRHKCLDCVNYDLCDNCILDAPTTHPLHEFINIAQPGRVVVHTVGVPTGQKVVHSANCNLCDSRVRGDRYKCTNCPDYDVCERCIIITPEQHPRHIFVKIREPSDIMRGRPREHTAAHDARCNACDKMIQGIRYKCMHPLCPDFDLCMDCEALPIAVHPDNHPLWKIKSNTQSSAHLQAMMRHKLEQIETQKVEAISIQTQESIVIPGQSSLFLPEEVAQYPEVEVKTDENDNKDLSVGETVETMTVRPGVQAATIPSLPGSTDNLLSLEASFVSDNNMKDGTIIAPGAEFVKSWRMCNSGSVAWDETTELAFIAGDRLAATQSAPNAYKVGCVNPGEVVDVWAADLKAPDEPGRYLSHWSLRSGFGRLFGDKVWCDVVVPELDKESEHSGSVILPSQLRNDAPAAEQNKAAVAGSIVTTESLLTDDLHTPALSMQSEDSQWEKTEKDALMGETARQRDRELAEDLEYVVLFDSDSESSTE